MAQKPKVAVIGLGNIGTALATNLVKGKRGIIVADRNIQKANEFSNKSGTLAGSLEISNAIKEADIIVFAVWFDVLKNLLRQYSAELKGKIIIDPSNPIAPDEKGGFKKIIAENESAGIILHSLVPEDAKLVKAFGTLGVTTLAATAFQKPEPAVLFYATDEKGVISDMEQLIRDSGFEPVHIGGLDQSIRIEVFGDLHEFGALGKTVTLKESKQLLQTQQHSLTHM